MHVTVRNRSDKVVCSLEIVPDSNGDTSTSDNLASVLDLKREFQRSVSGLRLERLRFYLQDGKTLLDDDNRSLQSYGLKENSVVIFKDIGPQIGWKTVYIFEYLGPIVIYALFYYGSSSIYGTQAYSSKGHHSLFQKILFVCWMFHFVKRELETLFVHRFGNDTMPLVNLWKNCSYYWVSATAIAFTINHPNFESSKIFSTFQQAGFILFVLGELGNGIAHLQLRYLRRENTRERRIPNGFLFEFVSCPNYTMEILLWIGFSLMCSCWTSWLFTCVGAIQMLFWAKKKHQRYRKEFPNYPKHRKALIPFIY